MVAKAFSDLGLSPRLHVPQLGHFYQGERERERASCHIIDRLSWTTSLHSFYNTTSNTATMDWNDLRNQVSNLSVYDLKAGVRKVQNGMYTGVAGLRALSDTAASRHELYRDGVQGARGDQQRAMGSII